MNLLSLFRRGHSTLQIALITKRKEWEVYNLLSRQREEDYQRLSRNSRARAYYRDNFKKERV